MYQAALQLNGTSRNQYNSPGKSPTTDYIEVVSTANRVHRKNQITTIFGLKRERRWCQSAIKLLKLFLRLGSNVELHVRRTKLSE